MQLDNEISSNRPSECLPSGRLTVREIQQAFAPLAEKYGPIIFLEQAAALSGYTPNTIEKKLSQGCFRNSVARGKPLRFWRDRFIIELMHKPASSKPLAKKGKEAGHEAD